MIVGNMDWWDDTYMLYIISINKKNENIDCYLGSTKDK